LLVFRFQTKDTGIVVWDCHEKHSNNIECSLRNDIWLW